MTRPSATRIAKMLAVSLAIAWPVLFVYLRNPVLGGGKRLADAAAPDPATLRAHVDALAFLHPSRSLDHPASLLAAEAYVAGQLGDMGYEVEAQEVRPWGGPPVLHNLIVRYGPREARERVVVGAHVDVYGDDNPGADDNASGVAVLLEVARLLQRTRPAVSVPIELVAYTLEEPPCFATPEMGSVQHARRLRDQHVAVRLMISIEMVGYFDDALFSQSYPSPLFFAFYPWRGDFLAIIGRPDERSITRAVKSAFSANSTVPVVSLNAPAFVQGVDFSDHRSYWAAGWPAVMVTDTAMLRNHAYHGANDTAARLDYRKMAEVARGVFAAVVAVAND
jgi:Zn-dependent M28 family amino/carboxypeptidase